MPDPFKGSLMSSLTRSTWRRTFAPLSIRNLRIFFSGQVISLVGTWLQSTAQALLVYKLSGGRSEPVAITACCTAAPLLLLGPIMGGLTSHIHRRHLVIATQVFELLLAAFLGVLVHTGIATLTSVYVMALLLGCAESVYFPAVQNLLREISGTEHIRSAVGLNAVISNIARFAGPMLAGILIESFGVSVAFFTNSLSFVAVIVSLYFVEDGEQVKTLEHEHWSFMRTARLLVSDTRLIGIFAIIALMNVLGQSCYSLIPALEKGDARATGVLLGSAGLGSLLSAICVMPFFQGFAKPGILLSGAILWMGTSLALVATFDTLLLQLLFMWTLGLSTTVIFVTTLGLLQTIPPEQSRGAFFGLFSASFYGTQPVAALALAYFADRGSSSHTIQGSAVIEIVGSLLLLLLPRWRAWSVSNSCDFRGSQQDAIAEV
jgi:MFS family permease